MRVNMTLSAKPEVHNSITTPPEEDRASAISNMHEKLPKTGRVVLEISSQIDRHTDMLTTILCSHTGGGVTIALQVVLRMLSADNIS